jgi:uncharacterized protein YjeT (DUF2065 family)
MKLLVTLIGLVLVLEGLPYVAAPEAMRRWLVQLSEMKSQHLRTIGLLAMGAGFLILFVAQKAGFFQ